jgi:uncharacterized ferredoxin-like protein
MRGLKGARYIGESERLLERSKCNAGGTSCAQVRKKEGGAKLQFAGPRVIRFECRIGLFGFDLGICMGSLSAATFVLQLDMRLTVEFNGLEVVLDRWFKIRGD